MHIKDIAEDAHDLLREVERMLDLKRPLNQKSIKLDAAVRFSKPVQKMIKMIFADLGIKSMKDLEHVIEQIAMKGEDMIEHCPYFQRMKKTGERMIRFAMTHVQVDDLPNDNTTKRE